MSVQDLTFSTPAYHYAFGQYDRVIIEGQAYRIPPHAHNEVGWLLEFDDASGRTLQFTHDQLSRLGSLKRIRVERDHFAPPGIRPRSKTREGLLSSLTADQQARITKKWAWVEAFCTLKREKRIKTTIESIEANRDLLYAKASAFVQTFTVGGTTPSSIDLKKAPCARSLLSWVSREQHHGIGGLGDNMHRRGNRTMAADPVACSLLSAGVRRYMSPLRPSIKAVYDGIVSDFAAHNAQREKESLPPVSVPSLETVRRHIHGLDPYAVALTREGPDAARKAFMPVARGIEVTFPLERVEIDENAIDIVSLMESTGLLNVLTDQEKSRLGLDKTKARWWMTVAICARTRCILGLVFSRNPSSRSSLKVLEMILKDKGQWADAAGSLGSWDMHGLPMKIVTDNGAAFVSSDFRMACEDLGITTERAPAGLPEMRGRMERFFRSVDLGLFGRLPGRTFGSIKEKGDADPEAGPALTFDDLAFCLTRWIVDIYHNTPHAGLGGETPLQCWRRLVKEYGVTPPPDSKTNREIFGHRLTRTLSKQGVRVLGLTYHSTVLAELLMHRENRDVEVRWHPDDLGAVTVHVGGKSIEAICTTPGFDGVSAYNWTAAARTIASSKNSRKTVDREVVLAALKAIEDRSGNAMRAAGLLTDGWDEDHIHREENRLFIGFNIGECPKPTRSKGAIGRSIPADARDEPAADNASAPQKDAPSPAPNSTGWSIEE